MYGQVARGQPYDAKSLAKASALHAASSGCLPIFSATQSVRWFWHSCGALATMRLIALLVAAQAFKQQRDDNKPRGKRNVLFMIADDLRPQLGHIAPMTV